ncbi:MAG TPA: hypothetical protein VIG88_14020 [Lysobacter sp.]
MTSIDTSGEAWRRTCEARYWLREGYTTPETVEELLERIRKRRGCAAAEQLRADMRAQWSTRHEWLAGAQAGAA